MCFELCDMVVATLVTIADHCPCEFKASGKRRKCASTTVVLVVDHRDAVSVKRTAEFFCDRTENGVVRLSLAQKPLVAEEYLASNAFCPTFKFRYFLIRDEVSAAIMQSVAC